MLVVDLQGPFRTLPDEGSNTLLSIPNARGAGLFIWTFEHNRAHRIHFVGAAASSIAEENIKLISEILLGKRAIYDPEKLVTGDLEIIADANSSIEQRCNAVNAAFAQIRCLNIFFAPSLGEYKLDEMVSAGIIRKLLKFGELPTAWLEHSLRHQPAASEDHGLTIRFQRPAFIASLPDEMYL